MDGRALITRVVLENYKSIAFCDVKLGPLSILVGPNGAGKSNFVDALRFLSEAMNAPVENAFRKREGFSNVLRRGARSAGRLGLRVDFITSQGLSGLYSVRFTQGETKDYIIERQKCDVGGSGWVSHVDRLGAPDLSENPEYAPAWRLIGDGQFYNFVLDSIRRPVPSSKERVLFGDGANLANVVHNISRRHRDVHERITEYLKTIYPALVAIETTEAGGYRILQFRETKGIFNSLQMSDGTLRSLAALVALFQRAAGADDVSIVGLEEPETALHPAAAGVLFDAMREASASVQVITTTHSADLLDKKEIDTDAILSVELVDETTRIGHLDHTGRQALRQELYTPGELMRMNYLRPESLKIPDDSEIESELFKGA
jgi:predicted ATPase